MPSANGRMWQASAPSYRRCERWVGAPVEVIDLRQPLREELPTVQRPLLRFGQRRPCLVVQPILRQLLAQAIQSTVQFVLKVFQPQQRVRNGFETS